MKKILTNIIYTLFVLFLSTFLIITNVSAATTTATYVWSATDLWGWTEIWNNTSNAIWNTTASSANSIVLNKNDSSNFFGLTNFDLSWAWLPSNAIINGIQMDVERVVDGTKITDTTVQLTKDGTTVIWTNMANNTDGPTSKAITTYGDLTNLWWTTWTASELLSPNFWIILQYINTNQNKARTVEIFRVSVTVDYTAVNNAPTDITLSSNSILENEAIWTLVWTLATTDSDIWDTHTYSFTCTIPWIDDASFSIAWSNLNSNEVFDFATKSSYDVCIRTDDWNWGTFDKDFTINIEPLANSAPTDITLSNSDILETEPVWTLVWTFSTTDPNIWDTHTYGFSCTIPWVDDASFAISWLNLNSNEVFDFATKSSYDICIRTDDLNWGTFDKNFTITILQIPPNNPPTDITLSNSDILEGQAIWTLVWIASTTDADILDTHSYDFSCSVPWVDDSSFAFSGSNLNSNEIFNFATKSSYDICIKTDDWNWATFDKNFTITVLIDPNAWYAWTATDVWWGSFAWINTIDATLNTTNTFSYSTIDIKSTVSNTLSLTNFNLSSTWLPDNVTIDGIQVEVERDVTNTKVQDTTVQLTKDWAVWIWNNNALIAAWPTTKAITTYGTTTDLWWTTWTPNELLSSNFWVLLNYTNTWNWTDDVNIYRVRMIITYTPNNIPTDIILSNSDIDSNLPIWSLVWTLSTIDADIWDIHSYDLSCTVPWVDDSSFAISGSNLNSNEIFDDTVKSSYDICIRTDDARWGTFDKNFTITILPPVPNSAPTDITISNNDILEALPVWSLVWNLTTTDVDITDTHTYSFVCTVPWVDDSSFEISGSELNSNEIFEQSVKSSYDICIRTNDGRWGVFDKNFTITVLINPNIGYAWATSDLWGGSHSWININDAIGNTTATFAYNTLNTKDTVSNTLSLTGFNLIATNIPTNAIIGGIEVDIERNVTNTKVQDTTVQLTKDWIVGLWNNNALIAAWPTTKAITTYGTTTDLWWTSWRATELMSDDFWVLLNYTNTWNWADDVNIYRVLITITYTLPIITNGPGWVLSSLQYWLKADAGTSTTTDWNSLATWNDQSWNWYDAWAWISPLYRDNITDNLNYNPVVDFNWSTQYLENLENWMYTDSYFAVIIPDEQIDAGLSWQVPLWFDCESWVLSSWTCWLQFGWLTLWAFTSVIGDEIITHAIGSSTNWRSSQIWVWSYEALKPMLINMNENTTADWTEISEKWTQVDNFNINTYQTLSSADYSIWMSTDSGTPMPYNGKIAEIVNYNSNITVIEKQKIESYLSLKYWMTLKSGTLNYLASDGTTTIWDTTIAWTYINDIFWIWRDDLSELWQVKSKSINNDNIITLEAIWEWTNSTPTFTDISDLEFLTISNDAWWNTWTATDAPATYYILSRKWRAQETWEVWTVNLDFDMWNINFDIPLPAAWTDYYYIYDSNNDDLLSDETPQLMTNTTWNIWQISWIDINTTREFSIATLSTTNNIPTDIALSNSTIDENVVIWTTIWTLTTTDADVWDTHTYSFVSGAWDTDNLDFTISWDVLSLNASPDYEIQNSYSVRIETDDGNLWQFQKAFTITINDIWEIITSLVDFENSLDSYKYTVTSWTWTRSINNPSEWIYSFESSNTWDNTQSCFEITQTFTSTWTIDFDYKVSSESNSDYLKFYINAAEQQIWSWDIPWATYTKNDVAAWTNIYKWCYIKDWAWAAWTDNSFIDYIQFTNEQVDSTVPIISSINYASWILLPWWNHDIIINYSDLESWIDILSDTITLNKWDWSIWWADIAASWFDLLAKTITSTIATYPTNNLTFWKYRYNFSISDISLNTSSTWAVFYIDEPELIISTWSLDIWLLENWVTKFSSWEFVITVKTVWAWFQVILNKDSALTEWTVEIIDWNWIEWVWFDQDPYTSTINLININEILATQAWSINIDWNKNSYIYSIKLWALIWEEQAAWNYSSNIKFWLDINY